MANMSYCRFQNTLLALRDCYWALRDNERLSRDEFEARQELIKLCMELAEDAEVYLQESFEDHLQSTEETDEEDD